MVIHMFNSGEFGDLISLAVKSGHLLRMRFSGTGFRAEVFDYAKSSVCSNTNKYL